METGSHRTAYTTKVFGSLTQRAFISFVAAITTASLFHPMCRSIIPHRQISWRQDSRDIQSRSQIDSGLTAGDIVKVLTLVAVVAMLFVNFFGSNSSVGGPMTDLLISFVIMLAVGIYESWSKKCGFLRWVLNIVLAVTGGILAIGILGAAMEAILTAVHFQGVLATSQWRFVVAAITAIMTVLGSWIPVQILNRVALRFAR